MKEIWKPVVGCPAYHVSNLGRVKRVVPDRGATPGRILVPVASGKYGQYRKVALGRKGPRRNIHRLVAKAFLGPPPSPKHEVNHKNGDTADNRACNLEWVTRRENNLHAYRELGREAVVPIGEKQWNHKLSAQDVIEIRRLWDTGQYTQREIGEQFDVLQSTVSGIVLGKSWKHLL